MLYASSAWIAYLSDNSRKKLKAIRSTTSRIITGSQWLVWVHSFTAYFNIQSVRKIANRDKSRLKLNIKNSNFIHIKAITNRHSLLRRKFLKRLLTYTNTTNNQLKLIYKTINVLKKNTPYFLAEELIAWNRVNWN